MHTHTSASAHAQQPFAHSDAHNQIDQHTHSQSVRQWCRSTPRWPRRSASASASTPSGATTSAWCVLRAPASVSVCMHVQLLCSLKHACVCVRATTESHGSAQAPARGAREAVPRRARSGAFGITIGVASRLQHDTHARHQWERARGQHHGAHKCARRAPTREPGAQERDRAVLYAPAPPPTESRGHGRTSSRALSLARCFYCVGRSLSRCLLCVVVIGTCRASRTRRPKRS